MARPDVDYSGRRLGRGANAQNKSDFLFKQNSAGNRVGILADQYENEPVEPAEKPAYADLRAWIPTLPLRNYYRE